jgi:hypothetical protein
MVDSDSRITKADQQSDALDLSSSSSSVGAAAPAPQAARLEGDFYDEHGGQINEPLSERVRAVMEQIRACNLGARLAEVPTLFAFGPIYDAIARAVLAERAACAANEQYLLEVILAARDGLAAFVTQTGYLPEQRGYAATMTQAEKQASDLVRHLDGILDQAPLDARSSAQKGTNGEDH